MPVDHYENFPVASVLCPPALRPPIAAIYHFARTADDIADEGDARPTERLAVLAAYRADLLASTQGIQETRRNQGTGQAGSHSGRWPHVFNALPAMVAQFQLPLPLLQDLLAAFEQDVRYTAAGHCYADRAELLAYCRLSANPVGRLLLHLYGVADATSLAQSDCICSALQLINFWQDLSVDIPRRRYYLPIDACAALGLRPDALQDLANDPRAIQLVQAEVQFARALMQQGAPLARRLPGRAGWELRLVVQGGLRILDKIAAMGFDTLRARPKLRWYDVPVMVWRAMWM